MVCMVYPSGTVFLRIIKMYYYEENTLHQTKTKISPITDITLGHF